MFVRQRVYYSDCLEGDTVEADTDGCRVETVEDLS